MSTKNTPAITGNTPHGTPAKNPLAKSAKLADNTATTKLIAVQPSRQSLAIFTPSAYQSIVGVRHIQALMGLSVYGGLIGVNKTPKGNSPSRLLAVVETCHPICGVVSLTKLIGVFA